MRKLIFLVTIFTLLMAQAQRPMYRIPTRLMYMSRTAVDIDALGDPASGSGWVYEIGDSLYFEDDSGNRQLLNSVSAGGSLFITADGDTFKVDMGTALNVLDIEVANSSIFSVDSSGNVTQAGNLDLNGNYLLNDQTTVNMQAGEAVWSFDDGASKIAITDDADLNHGTGDFSIRFRFLTKSASTLQTIYSGRESGTENFTIEIQADNTLNAAFATGGVVVVQCITSSTISANTWYDVTFVVDRDVSTYCYINGVVQALGTNTKDDGANVLDWTTTRDIGTYNSDKYFDGEISHAKLYNRALSAAEVLNLSAPTAFADVGASQTALVTGTDSDFSGAGNWTTASAATITVNYDPTDGSGRTTTMRIEAGDGSNEFAGLSQASFSTPTVAGKKYRLSFYYKFVNAPTGAPIVQVGGTTFGSLSLAASDWTLFEEEDITVDGTNVLVIYVNGGSGGSADNEVLVDACFLTQIGEVFAIDANNSSTTTAYDRSGNGNNGTITGATLLHPQTYIYATGGGIIDDVTIDASTFTSVADMDFTSSGAGFNFTTHSDAGDDFAINTSAFVVEGDNGNVGIGTASPAGLLDVRGTDGTPTTGELVVDDHVVTIGALNNSANVVFDVQNRIGTSMFNVNTSTGGNITIYPGNGDGHTLITAGNVGIGTTAPAVPIHIDIDGGSAQTPLGGTMLLLDNTGTGGNAARLNIQAGNAGIAGVVFGDSDDDNQAYLQFNNNGRLLQLFNAGAGLTIDASANSTFGGDVSVPTKTPASAAATGTTGTIAWDADYIYVCTATNTWKRTAIATW